MRHCRERIIPENEESRRQRRLQDWVRRVVLILVLSGAEKGVERAGSARVDGEIGIVD